MDAYGCSPRETSWGRMAIATSWSVSHLLSHVLTQIGAEQRLACRTSDLDGGKSRDLQGRVSLRRHHPTWLGGPGLCLNRGARPVDDPDLVRLVRTAGRWLIGFAVLAFHQEIGPFGGRHHLDDGGDGGRLYLGEGKQDRRIALSEWQRADAHRDATDDQDQGCRRPHYCGEESPAPRPLLPDHPGHQRRRCRIAFRRLYLGGQEGCILG